MNLKILFLIVLYWAVWISVLTTSAGILLQDEGFSTNAELNTSSMNINETRTGGIFSGGVSFTRFFGFALFGIGLSSSTPSWLALLIGIWQTSFTIFTIGFIISSIWNG